MQRNQRSNCQHLLKNWCFWTVVLEKTLESPLDCREIQLVHPKGDQSWVFIGRTDVEAETPILWPPDSKSWLIWKYPDAGKDWGQEEKGMTEDEMVEWHHRLNGHGSGWTPGVWWWTGRSGVLRFMELRRVRHGWTTELNWACVWEAWMLAVWVEGRRWWFAQGVGKRTWSSAIVYRQRRHSYAFKKLTGWGKGEGQGV